MTSAARVSCISNQKDEENMENTTPKYLIKISDVNKQRIKRLCYRVLADPVGDDIDEYVRYVKDMVVIRLANPFERLIKQRIETSVNHTLKPILKRLEVLENKISFYENNVLKLSDGQNETRKTCEILRKELVRRVEGDPLQDTCLVIPNETLVQDFQEGKITIEENKNDKKQMIVRITSWRCKPEYLPDKLEYRVDLTKRSVDLLVEGFASPEK